MASPPWVSCARWGCLFQFQCIVGSISDISYPDLVCHQLWMDTELIGSSHITPAFTDGTAEDALSEINLCSYGILLYDKGAKNIH